MPHLTRTSWFAILLLLMPLGACGGGSSSVAPSSTDDGTTEPAGRPAAIEGDGSADNVPPPEAWFEPDVTPIAPLDAQRLEELEEERPAHQGLADTEAARVLLAAGLDEDYGATPTRSHFDAYGSFHARYQLTWKGVPVFGCGFVVHRHRDGTESDATEKFARGIEAFLTDATPTLTPDQAEAIAEADYDPDGTLLPELECTIGICPSFVLQLEGRGDASTANRDEFHRVLQQAQLVYQVDVGPDYSPLDNAALAVAIAGATENTDTREDETARDDNGSVGGWPGPTIEVGHSHVPLTADTKRYLIDAGTGEIVSVQSLTSHDGWADNFTQESGEGHGFFSGRVSLDTAKSKSGGGFLLMDVSRVAPDQAIGNIVWHAQNKDSYNWQDYVPFVDAENTWGDGSILGSEDVQPGHTRAQTPGVDVAYGMQETLDFLKKVLMHDGTDGAGAPQHAAVHFDVEFTDARYNHVSQLMVFGDGSASNMPGNYSLGTVAHEMGHAVWFDYGLASNTSESRALNEGHADVLGAFADMYEAIAHEGPSFYRLRNFADWRWRVLNPAGYSEEHDDFCEDVNDEGECIVFGRRYWDASLETYPEHVAGLPFARAVMHLADGAFGSTEDDTHYSQYFPNGMAGIGVQKAAKIWLLAVTSYLPETSDYSDMRDAFMDAAIFLYGNGSTEHRATQNAFAAINIGVPFVGAAPPEITWAKVFNVNPKDLIAEVYCIAQDDAGVVDIDIQGFDNTGRLAPPLFHGLADLMNVPAGSGHQLSFEAKDAAGNSHAVKRPFTMPQNRQLLVNGSFETDDGWTSEGGLGFIGSASERALVGRGYAVFTAPDVVYQDVAIPADATDVSLVYWVLVRDGVLNGRWLNVTVEELGGDPQVLDSYDHTFPRTGRGRLRRGYHRREFDLTAYAGKTIRLAFDANAQSESRFVIDHVALTYQTAPNMSAPAVTVRDADKTVEFRVVDVSGIDTNEVSSISYVVNGVVRDFMVPPQLAHQWFGCARLDLLPTVSWVRCVVRGLNNQVIAISPATWFVKKPYFELVEDGGFESGLAAWPFNDPPDRVAVLTNDENNVHSYRGARALRLGHLEGFGEAELSQELIVPFGIKTLTFSIRYRAETQDLLPSGFRDRLFADFLNKWGQEIDSWEIGDNDQPLMNRGESSTCHGWTRTQLTLSVPKYAGRKIFLRLRAKNQNVNTSQFFIDSVSLTYTTYGLQQAP